MGNVISQGGNLISNGNIHTMHHRIPQSASLINLQIQRHAGNMVPEALEAGKELNGQGIGRFLHGLVHKGARVVNTIDKTDEIWEKCNQITCKFTKKYYLIIFISDLFIFKFLIR